MTRSLLLLSLLVACGDDPAASAGDSGAAAVDRWSPDGAYGVGTVAFTVTVPGRDAPIPARAWYPSLPDTAGDLALADLVDDADDRATLAALVADAPAGCPTASHPAVVDAVPAELEPSPLIVSSHCHTCLRLSNAAVASRLASHGFVVVAPDHEGNTLFDLLDGDGGGLDEETLAQRAADASATLTAALDGAVLPAGVAVDPDRIGALGHSFGGVTVGRLLRDDPRVSAGVALGAPIDNPLLRGVDATTVTAPVLLVRLDEDHSIGAIGNDLITDNYEAVAGPAWLAAVPDAGHWSVSDLCGVVEGFLPGCGDDTRMEGGEPFSYIDPADGRATAGLLAAAFFAHALQGDPAAGAWLAEPETPASVVVTTR
jgi:predicted dienelactone hydrolase